MRGCSCNLDDLMIAYWLNVQKSITCPFLSGRVMLFYYRLVGGKMRLIKYKYSGLLILHNHVNKKFPLFSATDRYNHVKLWKFMGNKREGFIIASGVYANNMLAIKVGKQRRMIYVRIRRNDS